MPNASPGMLTSTDLLALFNDAKAYKWNTLLYEGKLKEPPPVQVESNPVATKKTPDELAEQKVSKAISDVMDNVRAQINRKIINAALREKIRSLINAEFGNMLSPAEIDRLSTEVSRSAAYKINDLKALPPSLKLSIPVQGGEETVYTAEPSDEIDNL